MESGQHNGIDRLLADQELRERLRRGRVGLLSSRVCRTATGKSTAAALQAALAGTTGQGLVRLFAAEHGWSTAAAPGAAVDDAHDPQTSLPVHSVYGIRQRPDPAALADLDAIVIDLRDMGVRCYTYATTAARFLSGLAGHTGLAGHALEVIICDRPNPLGAKQAGPDLDPNLRNFLGYFDIPFVHGQTLGQLLSDFNHRLPTPCDLTVIPADMAHTEPAWHPPSPSLTHPHTVPLYPGLVLLEGTNVSEGRGTEQPFRCVLAPWLEPASLLPIAEDWPLAGLSLSPTTATPQSGKFSGEPCHGLAFQVTDPTAVDGLALGVHLLAALSRYPQFQWTPGKITPLALPWQDEPAKPQQSGPFIDYLMGSRSLRTALAGNIPPAQILASWATNAQPNQST
ncbi:MAG: exo-beta-N-acetylmuramidase NamZ family protein [Alphaproteobacteria bacterium]